MASRLPGCYLLIMLIVAGVSPMEAQSSDVLPAPLYFIRYNDQIWRMETDATILTQITDEDSPVTYFDVSPIDGALVYVSDNDLILADSLGENPTVLVDGIRLVEDADTGEGYLEKLNGQIRAPRWSLDAEQIAFAMGGVNVIAPDGHEPEMLYSNSVPADEADPMIAFLNSVEFRPESWSPDGTRLLVNMLMPPESSELLILGLENGSTTSIINSEDFECCYPSWSVDSSAIYYSSANHFFTTGLWRADAETGESARLLHNLNADGISNLVAYPQQLSDGYLYSFMTIIDNLDPNNIMPLTMYRSAPNGSEHQALREDSHLLGTVLWAQDGSGAVIEDLTNFEDTTETSGPLHWLAADGSPAFPLDISGYNLRWGGE